MTGSKIWALEKTKNSIRVNKGIREVNESHKKTIKKRIIKEANQSINRTKK